MNLTQLKADYINGIYYTKALLIKDQAFTLQSGKSSHIYLNHRDFLAQHHYLILIAKIYHELASVIPHDYILGTVDSVMSPIIVGAMSVLYQQDYVVVKKTSMAHGTKEDIYGNVKNSVLLIDDMTSTGGTLIEAAEKIRAAGGNVDYAIISAYRDNTAIENLKQHNITLLSIASFGEIITQLQNTLTIAEKTIIQQHPLVF